MKYTLDKKFLFEIIGLIAVLIGLYFTHSQLKQNEKLSRDTYLTGLWNEIMQESINYPQFQDKVKTYTYKESFSPYERTQYENYVRWIGGFMEDLYTYEYKNEGLLFFDPTIETFLDTHCVWFSEHTDYYKYTQSFYKKLRALNCK